MIPCRPVLETGGVRLAIDQPKEDRTHAPKVRARLFLYHFEQFLPRLFWIFFLQSLHLQRVQMNHSPNHCL